jgi:hypothetical protein
MKAEGTEEPLGIITLLPFKTNSTQRYMHEILQYCLTNMPTKEQPFYKDYFAPILQSKEFSSSSKLAKSALFLSTRLLNTPIAIIPPLHRALMDDLEWASTENTDVDARPSWKSIDTFLVISKLFFQPFETSGKLQAQTGATRKKTKHPLKKKKIMENDLRKNTNWQTSTEFFYYRFEEELYEQYGEHVVKFPVTRHIRSEDNNDGSSNDDVKEALMVCTVKREHLPKIIAEIELKTKQA